MIVINVAATSAVAVPLLVLLLRNRRRLNVLEKRQEGMNVYTGELNNRLVRLELWVRDHCKKEDEHNG